MKAVRCARVAGCRSPARLAAILAAAVLFALGGCGAEAQPPSGVHVVVVLVDQLRKDSADSWMPQVGKLASRGVVFDDMRTAAPWTYPSVMSLLSGLYPQQHGATGHMLMNLLTSFDPKLPLLPGILREAGYHAAGFVANPFFHRFNPFHQSFDHYDIDFVGNRGNLRSGPDVWRTGMFADSMDTAIQAFYDARRVTGPEFTWVHYIDVHGPWDDAPFPADYEASVRWIDERIAGLHAYFQKRYQGRLLFVVTSDHGRDLGDDLEVGDGGRLRVRKKSMHDFNLRVPLAVLPSAWMRDSARLTGPCSNVDVLPTLLDWLGLAAPRGLPGVSLLPWARGGEPPADRALYARNDAFGLRTDAAVHSGHKYVRYLDPGGNRVLARRVFDLASDPREIRTLRTDFGELREEVLAELAGTDGIEYEAPFRAPSPEVVEQLRALGYL